MTNYNRTPHALTSNTALKYAPSAAELQAGDKIDRVSPTLGAQLAAQQAAARKGKNQNFTHVKLLAEGRTATSKTYQNADGTKTVVYTAQASSYRDAQGTWQDVNTALAKDSSGVWHTKANSWQASFGNSSAFGVALTKDGQTFRMIPAGAKNVQPEVSGKGSTQTVTYKQLWKGVDLQYTVAGSEVKENIIVHSAAAATEYGFTFSGASLTPSQSQAGMYQLDGAFSGFALAGPTISTADKGTVTKNSPVSQNVQGDLISVKLDRGWLTSRTAKAFPLVIDPTVFTVPVGSNYNNFTLGGFSCGPGQGCGNSIGHDAVNNVYWRFIYQASVPSSPGQYLVSAKLHVEMHAPDGVHDYGITGAEGVTVDHASCTTGYNCIDTSPTYGEASASITTSGDIEMAPMYRAAVAAGTTNPWMIVHGDESSGDTYKYFDDTKTSISFTYETLPTQSTIGTATYGPAPSAWFGTDRKPLTTPTNYTTQVPHSQTAYDEGIHGLATAYYNVKTASNGTGSATAVLFGAPKSHATGIGPASGDILQTWNGTPPFTPDVGYGWGASLTGDVHLTSSGVYTFRVFSNDGARLWVDDNLIANDWADGPQRFHSSGTFTATYNATDDTQNWHRIRLDYYNKAGDTNARLELYMTPPSGTETSATGSLLTPLYGLNTTDTTYDSSANVGNEVTTNSYGSRPELALLQSTTVDPAGLNLTTSSTYEAQGTTGSYLRQLSKTLPGGVTTNYTYYGATETRSNPCVAGSPAVSQAGMQKLITQPDPDGAGTQTSITHEYVYDSSGRVVAAKINSDPWQCTTYDTRGRKSQITVPALPDTLHVTRPARTVTYNYAVSGNPLVSSVADPTATIKTTVDLLGRMLSYVDTFDMSEVGGTGSTYTYTTTYTYDNLGRQITKTGGNGTEIGTDTYVYDNYNRLTTQKYDNVNVATVTYDSAGRIQTVNYPAAGTSLSATVNLDSLGRTSGRSYSTPNGPISDTGTLSQSGMLVSATDYGLPQTYTYDKDDRLTGETYGNLQWTYSFATPTTCSGTYNPNAGKDSNRTNVTEKQNGNIINNVNYCYDYADRLVASTNSSFSQVTYDAHGNISSTPSSRVIMDYDSSDRLIHFSDSGTAGADYQIDPLGRYTFSQQELYFSAYSDSGSAPAATVGITSHVSEQYVQLPGDVMMTVENVAHSPAVTTTEYSLPDLQGNIFANARGGDGALTAIMQYDGFGLKLGGYTPVNRDGDYFGNQGQHGIITNELSSNQFTFMGARLYMPTLGRFAQVDQVDGGNENDYIYPQDPVNNHDTSGKCLPECLILLYPLVYNLLNDATEAAGGVGGGGIEMPALRAGAKGGVSAGKSFSNLLKKAVKDEEKHCAYCGQIPKKPQVDHIIPKKGGGNATRDNAQLTCQHCNASKGARALPKTPPIDYSGGWPPAWW